MKFQLANFKYGLLIGGISGIIIIASIFIIPQLDLKSRYWSYTTEDQVISVEISYDGSYYFAGTRTGLFLFHLENQT